MKIQNIKSQIESRVPSSDKQLERESLYDYAHGDFQDAVSDTLSNQILSTLHKKVPTNDVEKFSGMDMNTLKDIDKIKKEIKKQSKDDWAFMEKLDSVCINDRGRNYTALVIPASWLQDKSERKEIMEVLGRLANNPAVISHIKSTHDLDVGLTPFIIYNDPEDMRKGEEVGNPIGLTYEELGPDENNRFTPTLTGATGGNSITPELLNEYFEANLPVKQIALMSELRLAYIQGQPVYVITKTKDLRDLNPGVYDQITNNLNGSLVTDAGYHSTAALIEEDLEQGHISPINAGDQLSTKFLDKTSPSLLAEASNYHGREILKSGERVIEFVDEREFDNDPEFEAERGGLNDILDYLHPSKVREKHGSEKTRII